MNAHDPAKDAHDSYYAAIEAIRQRGDVTQLKSFGFSALKAEEIALDGRRGDKYARQFIKLARDAK